MVCEKCGKEIHQLEVLRFNHDGSDSYNPAWGFEAEEDAVYMDLDSNWTGYELSEEEMRETIRCPHCKQFPFKNNEIQVYEIVRVVCFKDSEAETLDIENLESEIQKLPPEEKKEVFSQIYNRFIKGD